MPRRAPRPRRRRAPRASAVAVAALAALLTGSIAAPLGRAQPAPDAQISRAKDLYKSAEAAMKDGRCDDAARDYGAAYDLSKDPALFFKIAHANQQAGRCDVALIYYARYLREGKPSEQFVATTNERIAACGGDVRGHDGSAAPIEPHPPSPDGDRGSGSTAPASPGNGTAGSGTTAPAAPGGAAPISASSAAPATDVAAGGSAAAALALTPSNGHKVAWILGGGSIALVTLGGVLAYASSSSENDVRDLYVGFAGQPATFDAQTRKRYNDLVDEGHRYQHLSWAAFGLAGAAASAAAVLFVIGRRDEPAPHARVTPLVTTHGAGVAVTF